MKEELIKKVLEILNGTEFLLKEQVPEIVKQYLDMILINKITYIVISLSITLFAAFYLVKFFIAHRKYNESDNKNSDLFSEDDFVTFCYVVLGTTTLITGCILINHIMDIVAIYIAPKAYLIEYFR